MEKSMNNKKALLKDPFILLIIILTVIILFFIVGLSVNNNNDNIQKEDELGELVGINNSSYLYNLEQSDVIIKTIQTFYSQIYPNYNYISIETDSIIQENNKASFTIKSDSNELFYIDTTESKIIIRNSKQHLIYESPLIKTPKTSHYLIDKYFPYTGTFTNGDMFEADVSNNKQNIIINIKLCVTNDLKTESIRLVQDYIKSLDSDPNLFTYFVTDFCH